MEEKKTLFFVIPFLSFVPTKYKQLIKNSAGKLFGARAFADNFSDSEVSTNRIVTLFDTDSSYINPSIFYIFLFHLPMCFFTLQEVYW